MSELLNRNKNLVYTVTGNYDIGVAYGDAFSTDGKRVNILSEELLKNMGLNDEEIEKISLTSSMHEGGHIRFTDFDCVVNYLKDAQKRNYDPKSLMHIINVIEDTRIDRKLEKERPGYIDMRRQSYKACKKIITPSRFEELDLIKVICCKLQNLDIDKWAAWKEVDIDWNKANKLVNDIEKLLSKCEKTSDVLKYAESIYEEIFEKRSQQSQRPQQGKGQSDQDSKSDESDDKEEVEGFSGISVKSDVENTDREEDTDGEESEGDGNSGDGEGDSEGNGEVDGNAKGDDEEEFEGEESESDGASSGENGEPEESSEEEKEEESKNLSEEEIKQIVGGVLSTSNVENMVNVKDTEYQRLKYKTEAQKSSLNTKLADTKYWNIRHKEEYMERMSGLINVDKEDLVSVWTPQQEERINDLVSRDMFAGRAVGFYKLRYPRDIQLFIDKVNHNHKRRSSSHNYDSFSTLVSKGKILAKTIMELMREAAEESEIPTTSGRLNPTMAFRTKVNDVKVFNKTEYSDVGGYRVDLLIDSSGSQVTRVHELKCQAFILAYAFKEAGIPCRITSHHSNASYSNIMLLKDYDDPNLANINDFTAMFSNTDGIVYRALWEDIKMRNFNENHILIILSDGYPANDSLEWLVNKYGERGLKFYEQGQTWVDNNGKEVSVIQDIVKTLNKIKKHLNLLGIFVGRRPVALDIERKIFGNNFANITDPTRFVPIVAQYMKKVIK